MLLHFSMNRDVFISDAEPEDAYGMSLVRRKTWLATYPNEKERITKQDIEAAINKRSINEESKFREERIASKRDTKFWKAIVKNEIVGFIEVQKLDLQNKVRALYVLPEFQKLGIGTALMLKALKWLGDEKEVISEVVEYNNPAIMFYKKFGFI